MQSTTELHRQINPIFVLDGQVSYQSFMVDYQAFKPTEHDGGHLSVYDGDEFSPEDSYQHYVDRGKQLGTLKREPAGVLSVTVAECSTLGLNALRDDAPFAGHAHIDFTPHADNQSKRATQRAYSSIASQLRDLAVSRGWRFRPVV